MAPGQAVMISKRGPASKEKDFLDSFLAPDLTAPKTAAFEEALAFLRLQRIGLMYLLLSTGLFASKVWENLNTLFNRK